MIECGYGKYDSPYGYRRLGWAKSYRRRIPGPISDKSVKIADMVGNENIHVLLDMAKKKPVSPPRIIQRLADDSTRQGGIHGHRQSPEYAGAH
jgi:hypothetical protein